MVRSALLPAVALLCAGSQPARVQWSAETPGPGAKGAILTRDGTILCARTEGTPDGVRIVCVGSADSGRTWTERATIVTAPAGSDIGDGCLVQLRDGRVLYSYRDNRTAGSEPTYAIRVRESRDRGKTWTPHSTVASCSGPRGGLWSSFLLETRRGTFHCVYDDERTPWEAGFARHQWLTMRTWNAKTTAWQDPVTVSRAHKPEHLSRDGMASVVELPRGRLLCVFETVDIAPPHAGTIMSVTSDDTGRTWSWTKAERGMVYQAADKRYGAYCPWIARGSDGRVVCVFGLNEGRERPIPGGTPYPGLGLDIAAVESYDNGATWTRPALRIYAGSHRNAMPGIIALPERPTGYYCHWLDIDRGFLSAYGALRR